MVLSYFDKFTKNAIVRISAFRKKRRKKHADIGHNEKAIFHPMDDSKVLEFSKYAKLIPSQHYKEEKSRSDMKYNIAVDIESLLIKGHIEDKFYKEKHERIMATLYRVVLEIQNKSELGEFLNDAKILNKILKRRLRVYKDDDLKAMQRLLSELLRIKHKHYSKLHVSTDIQRTYLDSFEIRNDKKRKQRAANFIQKRVSTDISIPKYRHICNTPQCLLNTTPRKNSKKDLKENLETQDLQDDQDCPENKNSETSQKVLKKDHELLRKHLNFRYEETKNKLKCVDTKRFCIDNVKHCKTVARIVDERLRGMPQETGQLVYLYMKYSSGGNKELASFKYELMVQCLETYFFPVVDCIKITWTSEVNNFIMSTTESDVVTDIFGRKYDLVKTHIGAMMIVSQAGSDLLRHKQLCVFDTISVVLDIPRESLLTVHMDCLPQLFGRKSRCGLV